MSKPAPEFHACGASAVLMDFGSRSFDPDIQARLWHMVRDNSPLRDLPGDPELVLGVNNLMVRFNPLHLSSQHLESAMREIWGHARPSAARGKRVEIPVRYHTHGEGDIAHVAQEAGLSVDEVVRLHSGAEYTVACLGWVPGFAFMTGLPARLATGRKARPPARVPPGSVGIGGAQTGVIPLALPSGWNLIGETDVSLFDATRPEPCLLAPGDRVRFVALGDSR